MTERYCTPIRQIAEQVPLGFECRSCGASAYNWLMKMHRYTESGDTCCPDFRSWCEKADALRSQGAGTLSRDNLTTKGE
jgi:hypothetical protein